MIAGEVVESEMEVVFKVRAGDLKVRYVVVARVYVN